MGSCPYVVSRQSAALQLQGYEPFGQSKCHRLWRGRPTLLTPIWMRSFAPTFWHYVPYTAPAVIHSRLWLIQSAIEVPARHPWKWNRGFAHHYASQFTAISASGLRKRIQAPEAFLTSMVDAAFVPSLVGPPILLCTDVSLNWTSQKVHHSVFDCSQPRVRQSVKFKKCLFLAMKVGSQCSDCR